MLESERVEDGRQKGKQVGAAVDEFYLAESPWKRKLGKNVTASEGVEANSQSLRVARAQIRRPSQPRRSPTMVTAWRRLQSISATWAPTGTYEHK